MTTMQLMTRLIEEISTMRMPLVFKGAMVLTNIMQQYPINTSRETMDIDGDWVDDKPTMEQLEGMLNIALSRISPTLKAVSHREYSDKKSAGFTVLNNGEKEFTVDLSIRPNPHRSMYETNINRVRFIGASTNKIVADKIHSISHATIYRRVKDIYDLYLLSHLSGHETYEIVNILSNYGREIGDFKDFSSGYEELQYAYNKLRRIVNKPTFNLVYTRVRELVKPFIQSEYTRNYIWNGQYWV